MIHVLFDEANQVIGYTGYATSMPATNAHRTESRWDWKSKEQVDNIAFDLHLLTNGEVFIGVDNGESVSPRYDVVKAPKIGDEVSMAFNGDSYPQGKIASISKSYKVITLDNGKRFYRRRETGSWVYDKTWSLIPGKLHTQNPHL